MVGAFRASQNLLDLGSWVHEADHGLFCYALSVLSDYTIVAIIVILGEN